jgi:hypothetical protein
MKDLGNNLIELKERCPSKAFYESIKKCCDDLQLGAKYETFGTDFQGEFGGGFYLLETYSDLKQITSAVCDESNNRYKDITQIATVFDVCEYVDETYIQILLCTNNAGGDTYLVHKKFIPFCPNIEKSIELTKEANE